MRRTPTPTLGRTSCLVIDGARRRRGGAPTAATGSIGAPFAALSRATGRIISRTSGSAIRTPAGGTVGIFTPFAVGGRTLCLLVLLISTAVRATVSTPTSGSGRAGRNAPSFALRRTIRFGIGWTFFRGTVSTPASATGLRRTPTTALRRTSCLVVYWTS